MKVLLLNLCLYRCMSLNLLISCGFFKSAVSALDTSDISDVAGEDLSSDDEDEKMISQIEDLLEERRFLLFTQQSFKNKIYLA